MLSIFSQQVFPVILDMTLTGSLVIAAVLAIRLALRRTPARWRYLLWLVVAFRLACPVSLSAPVSLMGAVDAPITTQGTIQYVPRPTPAAPTAPQTTPVAPPPDASLSTPDLPPAIAPTPTSPSVMDILSVLWLIGMAVLLVYSVVSYVRLRRRLACAVHMEGRVWQCDQVSSPFILGFFRPRIYIPFGLDGETSRYVLAHENHHLCRGDHIIKPLAFLLLTLHWFNPLCWLAFHLMSRDMEMSCDEWVLSHREGDRRVYSTALLSFAANRRMPAPSPLAFSESEVRPRILNTLRWKKPRLWVTLAAGVLCVLVVLLCALNPKRPTYPYPFGNTYRVSELTYSNPMLSYVLDPDRVHFSINEYGAIEEASEGQRRYAHFGQTVVLTEENFDALLPPLGWAGSVDSVKLRRENQTTWYLETKDAGGNPVFCYLMQQKNGELYLAFGYHNRSDIEPRSFIRWLMKLEPDVLTSVTVTCRDSFVHTIYPVWYPKDENSYPSINAGSVHAQGELRLQTTLPNHDFVLHETSKDVEASYNLTSDENGLCVLPLTRQNFSGVPTIAEFRLDSGSGYYSFHVDFVAQNHIYPDVEGYVAHIMDTLESESYTIFTVDETGTYTTGTYTAPVAETRRTFLHRNGQLAGLTEDGSLLEAWAYGVDIKLDLPQDPDHYSYAGGVHKQDGWWIGLYPARNVVVQRYTDGRCRILSDEPINDGFDFLMGLNDYEKALHDWYVKEYGLTDIDPPYAIWMNTYYRSDIGYRHDGDGWYLYVLDNTWKQAQDGQADHWVSRYDTGSYLLVTWSNETEDTLVRRLQDEGWQKAEQEVTCLTGPEAGCCIYPDTDRGGCWVVSYAAQEPDPDQLAPQPGVELAELQMMALHFGVL